MPSIMSMSLLRFLSFMVALVAAPFVFTAAASAVGVGGSDPIVMYEVALDKADFDTLGL